MRLNGSPARIIYLFGLVTLILYEVKFNASIYPISTSLAESLLAADNDTRTSGLHSDC